MFNLSGALREGKSDKKNLIPFCVFHLILLKKVCFRSNLKYRAVVAERLRRLTRNQIPSGSVGSNPTDCGFFFNYEMFTQSRFANVPVTVPDPRSF